MISDQKCHFSSIIKFIFKLYILFVFKNDEEKINEHKDSQKQIDIDKQQKSKHD